jgi:pullulanase-type alpha-1,6-glucosidase
MANPIFTRGRAILAVLPLVLSYAAVARAAPVSVGIPGSYQHTAGCGGDWDPACPATQLTYVAGGDVWKGTFPVGAGTWEYKAALNGNWDENYGANATRNGPNIPLVLAADGSVRFYYDDKTHWVTSDRNSVIATVPGSFQSELGCPGDWDPGCFRSWLEDPTGTGDYSFTTAAIPPGSYEAKVAINESWDENYGQDGVPGGANIAFTVPSAGTEVAFQYNASTHVLRIFVGGIPRGNLALAQAHWVAPDLIAWDVGNVQPGTVFRLHAAPDGGLALSDDGVSGGTGNWDLAYDPAGLPADVKAKFPQLALFKAFRLPAAAVADAPAILKGQIAVSKALNGQRLDATSLQIPGVLDALYTYGGPLGVTFSGGKPTLRVWAPTARSVTLQVFDDSTGPTTTTRPMTTDGASGVWTVAGDPSWKWKYYLYEVEVYVRSEGKVVKNLVTDPYSFSLSMNSGRSQIVDLSDHRLKPPGWDHVRKPPLAAPEDIVVYELHVRDFSANDPSVPPDRRGTFLAFAEEDSNGMRHLERLAKAGLTHVHLLPSFDFATVDEDKSHWQSPAGDLSTFGPAATDQQAAVTAVKDVDGFNWGYDPWHYTVPEGSYSTAPDGAARIREFREMVQSLNHAGLRVVMDVVYNHTTASGQNAKSVLDRIVPGYYHRLNGDGFVETSTCCQNTASEHAMMEKLMVDSVVTWATAYKVDGFRFDLMGHHMKSNMLNVRAALDALTPRNAGVDGRGIYVYGEGWNFGEVANNARGVNATQLNMAGTGIGTFSDRLRDSVRGGGPFSPRRDQGFATGLFLEPNGTDQGSTSDTLAHLLHDADLTRLGMAGNLADYQLVDRTGATVTGSQLDYNGQPAGYAKRPDDTITYISAHDNETWFDALDVKLPQPLSMADRVRNYDLGVSVVMLSQGIPFFHAGDDLLRSKSADKNSYNSGDWFNRIDFTYQANNWGVGLPPAPDNQADWGILAPLLGDPALKSGSVDIQRARDHFAEMLRIRRSSTLFRLRTAEDIRSMVKQYNTGPGQVPGLVVEWIARPRNAPGDYGQALVVVNASPGNQSFSSSDFQGQKLKLHPVLESSSDPIVRKSGFDCRTGTLTVPARTVAVFVSPQSRGSKASSCKEDRE